MPTSIREQVKSNMPETYKVLVETAGYTLSGGGDVVGEKIKSVLGEYWPDFAGDDEDELETAKSITLTNWQKSFLAIKACHLLVPVAIDYYGTRTAISDSAAPGVFPRPETRVQYDRIKMLQAMDDRWLAQIARDESRFTGEVSSDVSSAAIYVDGSPDDFLSPDPDIMVPKGSAKAAPHFLPSFPPVDWS